MRGCSLESAMPRPKKTAVPSRSDINVNPCRLANKPAYRFVVTGPQPGGRRWRKFFETQARAEAYAHLRRVELSNVGTEGAALSAADRSEFLECRAKLEPYGVTLRQAVEMLLPTLATRSRTVPVERAVRAMREAQEHDGASVRHLSDLKSRLGQFERAFPGRELAGFSAVEVDAWLRELPVGNLARNHSRRIVGGLFTFGILRGWCLENPVSRIGKAKVAAGKVGILSAEQTARLLEGAPADAVAALAIAAFTGLRRAELERLDWREVRLAKGLVEVTASKAKTAARRFVPIRENLAAWLARHARPAGPVCPPNFRVRFDEARRSAGFRVLPGDRGTEWPDNGLRHSFASFHAAHFQDAGKLAVEMGHTTPGIVFQHYRELVEPEEAARYWNIRPAAAPANVVPMLAATA